MRKLILKFNNRQGNNNFFAIKRLVDEQSLAIVSCTESTEHSEQSITLEIEGYGDAIATFKHRLTRLPAVQVKREEPVHPIDVDFDDLKIIALARAVGVKIIPKPLCFFRQYQALSAASSLD